MRNAQSVTPEHNSTASSKPPASLTANEDKERFEKQLGKIAAYKPSKKLPAPQKPKERK
jgi:hypothetical protein